MKLMSETTRERLREEKDESKDEREELIMQFKIMLSLKSEEREIRKEEGNKDKFSVFSPSPALYLCLLPFCSLTCSVSRSVMKLFLVLSFCLAACENA